MKKQDKIKPKYNILQNTLYMVKLAWISKEKKVLILGALSAMLAVGLNLIGLYISPVIISAVESEVSITQLVVIIVAFVAGLMLTSAASAYVDENALFGRITVRSELITMINRKACTTSFPNVHDDKFTALLSKASECVSGNSQATEAVWQTLTTLTTNIVGFAIYIVLFSTVQPILMLIIVATTFVSYLVGNLANTYKYRHREEEAEAERHMEYISRCSDNAAAKDIRIFGLRPWLQSVYDKAMDAYVSFQNRVQKVFLAGKIVDVVLTFCCNAAAYAYLIAMVLDDKLTVAEFLLYFTAVSGFTQWVTGILNGFYTLHSQSVDISTVREFLEFPEPFNLESGKNIPESDSFVLTLENVSFRYPKAEKDTLININLTLHNGEKLAVVGLNGAGKTTLVKLMCGFLDPTQGRVLLNGTDIRKFNRQQYYGLFSAVFQNFSLLATSVAANVAQSEENIDMNRVRRCVELAGLKQKVESLPQGYESKLNRTVYDDAVMFSGGETQRLMLARALYKNAPIILLDEPTAALDPLAEADMYQKYDSLSDGKSSVYISHRLASTRFCDRIVLIDNASICEEGTHEQLLKAGGKYARLFEVQSKYYKRGGGEVE